MCQAMALRKAVPVTCPWPTPLSATDFFSHLSHRYVYDHIGGEHSEVIPELVASVATFAITTLWLGPCDIVYLWSILNCFGLNFELWVQKLAERGPLAQIEVSTRGLGLEVAGSLEGVALLVCGGFQPHSAPSPELCHHYPPGCQDDGLPCGYLVPSTSYGVQHSGVPVWVGPCPLSRRQFPIFSKEGALTRDPQRRAHPQDL